MGVENCTSCGGTCADDLSSLSLDVSSVSTCSQCYAPNPSGSSDLTLIKSTGCPDASWAGNGANNNLLVAAGVDFDSSEDCYKLTVRCYTMPMPPTMIPQPVTMWEGCKGGDGPTGSYTRTGGCSSSPSSLSVS